MPSPKTLTSLREKQDFIIKSREANYRDSLRLEGFALTSDTPPKGQSIEQLIEKYRAPVN